MDEIRINKTDSQSESSRNTQTTARHSSKKGKSSWLMFLVVAIAIVVLGYFFRDNLFGGGDIAEVGRASEYQSVFLTNGQVYFGKISNARSEYATLRDVFYLQVIQPPLQGPDQGDGSVAPPQQPQISLIKLGNELHGPTDEMQINRDHILFFEDLKENSQVVQAIRSFKESAEEAAAAAEAEETEG